jgi:hypothetical protein
LQDYSRLGITDTGDRRKIFGLVQAIRKDTEFNRTTNTTTTTMMNSGLRQPQSYATSTNNSRLPLPDTMPSSNGNNRGRRQSVISTLKPSNTPPHNVRNRTMSDAPRPDFQQQQQQQQQRAPFKDRRLELRRSLYLDQLQHQQQQQESESDSENESTTKNRKYRASAPLLDAYGVPLSPAKQARALSSFQNASASTTSRHIEYQQLPPSDLNQKIRVCVRKRPLSKKEVDKGDKDMAPATGNRGLQINEPK